MNDRAQLAARFEKSGFILLVLLFGLVTFWNFDLPGVQMDEANHVAYVPGVLDPAAAALHHYRLPDNALDLLDRRYRWPIVGGAVYNTAISAYLGAPWFAAVGFSQGTLRLFEAFLGLGSILAGMWLLRRLAGTRAALALGLVLVLDPVNMLSLRSQAYHFWYVILFGLLAAHCLLSLSENRGRENAQAFSGGLFLGLAALSYFVGLFVALPLAIWGLFMLRNRRRPLLWFIGGGLLGYAPLLYAVASIWVVRPEFLHGFGMPDFAAREAVPVFSLLNFERWAALFTEGLGQLRFARGVAGGFEPALAWPRLLILLFALGATLACALGARRRPRNERLVCGLLAATTLLYAGAAFFLKAMSFHHLLPLAFLLALQLALLAGRGGLPGMLAVVLCLLLALGNGLSLARAQEALQRSGGNGWHNEAWTLPVSLARNALRDYPPAFASWGFHLQFLFLTGGKLPYHFIAGAPAEKAAELLERHGRLAIYITRRDLEAVDRWPGRVVARQDFTARSGGDTLYSVILLEAAQP